MVTVWVIFVHHDGCKLMSVYVPINDILSCVKRKVSKEFGVFFLEGYLNGEMLPHSAPIKTFIGENSPENPIIFKINESFDLSMCPPNKVKLFFV